MLIDFISALTIDFHARLPQFFRIHTYDTFQRIFASLITTARCYGLSIVIFRELAISRGHTSPSTPLNYIFLIFFE